MDNRIFTACLVLLIALSPLRGLGQDLKDIEFLKQRDFGRYFISDMYSPNPASHVGAGIMRNEYNINPDRNSTFAVYSESVIGYELPLLSWDIGGLNPSKLAVSMPASVNFLLDISEPITHPIINTDYRIGAIEINYLYELGMGFIKNAAFRFIPFYHESSHLGDELTIYRKEAGFPITRVNATSNNAEVSLTLNDENASREQNHSLRLGSLILWNKKTGFYRMRPEEGDTSKITPSENRFVWYLQYQFQDPSSLIKIPGLYTMFSVELRNRVLYNYPNYFYDPKSSLPPSELINDRKYAPSLNGYFGWRYRIKGERASYLGLYARFYFGVNPYGQFRNIPGHRFYSLSLVYEN
jgi:hypothetical protein